MGQPSTPPTSTSNATNCSLAMRMQKKVLSKLSKRGVVRLFANERVSAVMDALFAILERQYGQQSAEKVVKNIIKLSFKLGAMEREHTLTTGQSQLMLKLERQLQSLTLALQSFQTIRYSYNQKFLLHLLIELRQSTHSLVQQTLSEKSSRRVDHIFDHLTNGGFLGSLACGFAGCDEKQDKDADNNDENDELLLGTVVDEQLVGHVKKFTDQLAFLMLGEESDSAKAV